DQRQGLSALAPAVGAASAAIHPASQLAAEAAPMAGSISTRLARQQQPQRQAYPRLQAAALAVAQFHVPAVQRGDALDDGQAQPGAGAAASAVATDEGIEDVAQLVLGQAGPAVLHTEQHEGRPRLACQARLHANLLAAIAQGVLDQVGKQALDGNAP